MRTTMAGAALALGLALTGCGQQALVGQGAIDPESPQLSAEEAREEAAHLLEEGVGHGAEGSGSEGAAAETGQDGATSGGESEAEAGAATDEGGGTVSSSGSGATGSEGSPITDQALAQFEQQFPAISTVVSEQQLRTTATEVCSAIASGGAAAGQQVVEGLPGVNAATSQQLVGFFDREVCTG